jgi:halocyanin-like protein
MDDPTRRRFLSGGVLTLGVVLAGCTGGNGDGDGDDNGDDNGDGNGDDGTGGTDEDGGNGDGAPLIDEYPVVEEWLTETELGGADDSWDGSIADETGTDTVTVDVGSEGNGGAFAYGPSAVAISVGTTVEWDWTGEGNPHNVEALPAEQLGESDFEFSSGEAVDGSGVQYTRAFEETGIALYHCEPHYSLGMKGAVVVVE